MSAPLGNMFYSILPEFDSDSPVYEIVVWFPLVRFSVPALAAASMFCYAARRAINGVVVGFVFGVQYEKFVVERNNGIASAERTAEAEGRRAASITERIIFLSLVVDE